MHALLFGCCLPGGPYDAQRAQRLAQAGFDYAEIAAAPLAAMTQEEFAALRREQEAGGLPIRAANCFLPGELSLFDSGRQEALRCAGPGTTGRFPSSADGRSLRRK